MTTGMIGRKVGMMRLFDGAGRSRGVSVIELGPNRVTQIRTQDRDGYEAVQVGFSGNRRRMRRPERGHLRAAGVEDVALSELREFRVADTGEYALGQEITVAQFEAGQFVNVAGISKGRGFAGGVRRWNFAGGPKTHGQSDRHRAPGSVGAGTTPGRVFKGTHMAGHMGADSATQLNLLVVATDPSRNLLFIEGSVPGHRDGIVIVTPGRRAPIADFQAPEIPGTVEAVVEEEPVAAKELGTNTVDAEAATEAAVMAETPEAESDEAPAAEAEQPEAEAGEAEKGEGGA